MKTTELFAAGYKSKIGLEETLATFIKRCRTFGDRMTETELKKRGVSAEELKEELASGSVKYEPNCGISKREIGYSLTNQGIAKAYRLMRS